MSQKVGAGDTAPDEDRPPRLLFVDDEPSILSALKRTFRGKGYDIRTATSAAHGLALLDREPADLVLSDMRMPEMDGAEFLERVFSRWPDTKRVLLTGYAEAPPSLPSIAARSGVTSPSRGTTTI
jgi:response regulator RpfG family c-di-GMP phosphodiesterase